jgi:hypothetical protein
MTSLLSSGGAISTLKARIKEKERSKGEDAFAREGRVFTLCI